MLITANDIKRIKSQWIWHFDDKQDLLEHIATLEAMIQPEVLAKALDADAGDRRIRAAKREVERLERIEADRKYYAAQKEKAS